MMISSASPVQNNLHACTFCGTLAPYKVQDDRRPAGPKNPADFLPPAPRQRTRARLAERVAGSRAARDRKRSFACAMAVASRDAPVPAIGKGLVGGTDRPSDETDRACAALPSRRAPRRPARIHKENTHHT